MLEAPGPFSVAHCGKRSHTCIVQLPLRPMVQLEVGMWMWEHHWGL
jgi:hypothetical protein